jgi:hypothetical protein
MSTLPNVTGKKAGADTDGNLVHPGSPRGPRRTITKEIPRPTRPCVLRSIFVNRTQLVIYESFSHVLGLEPTPNDPLTITVSEAARRSGLSRKTILRMIWAGRAAEAENTAA